MFCPTVLTALAFSTLAALAAPSPDNIALAAKYAPQWRFHPSEVYFPSTVEYFLSGVKLTDANGNVVNGAPSVTTLDDATNQGSGMYLSTDINAGKSGFLRGLNPNNAKDAVYTFIAPKANGVVDLYYWLFTPFNQGKSIPLLGEVGDHVGDWERMAIRTVNGVATQIDYHAHDDKGSGTIPWDQAPKFDNGNRPVGYVAQGSHGFWSSAGTFTYVNAVVFKLQDVTADGGVYWDTRDSLVDLGYPDSYTGDLEWLNYKGTWGNVGTTNCWWYIFHNECEVVTGPGGPLRDDVEGAAKQVAKQSMTNSTLGAGLMRKGPLSQTLGDVSSKGTSSYTIYLDDSVLQAASQATYPRIAVQQTCKSIVQPDSDAPADSKDAPQTTTVFGTAELTKESKFTVSVAKCEENNNVDAYAIGFCADDTNEDCIWSPASRKLRAFSSDASRPGIQMTTAIDVTDLDLWEW